MKRLLRLPVSAGPTILALGILLLPGDARAAATQASPPQGPGAKPDSSTAARDTTRQRPLQLPAINVTATRSPTDVFRTPLPVLVVRDPVAARPAANNAADLFTALPGLDVTGVGPTHTRPAIRGQRGQRILLLEDGLRLNNSRRQQDFGELPGLVDLGAIERVEIVRGPSSVLYGTDAIGGVVNLITRSPAPGGGGIRFRGQAGHRYSTADDQQRSFAVLSGNAGDLSFLVSGAFRRADPYDAPAGTFGAITLANDTRVSDTGVRDGGGSAYVGYRFSSRHGGFAKFERHRSDDAGFGYVDPRVYNPDTTLIRIRYPYQRFDRYTVGYNGANLGIAVADRLDVVAYYQANARDFTFDIVAPFGPTAPPGAGVAVSTANRTDLGTLGFRVEAKKLAASRVLLTYGADLFRDRSTNTDSSATTMVGFGPPRTTVSTVPQVPNADFRSVGVFAQGDVRLTERASVVVGARYQDARATTRVTPNLADPPQSSTDRTLVGSASAVYGLTRDLNAVVAVGRAFRSPNLVERFFNGPAPEGGGFQARNPDLKPETSLNVDFGLRFRRDAVSLEGFVFRNEIRDGIRIAPTGNVVGRLPEFRNVNVDRLRYVGVELAGDVTLPLGFAIGANYTHLASKDVLDPSNPVGDTFSNKLNLSAGYRAPDDRLSITYRVRHNGDRKDVVLGANPIGPLLPAFTVHSVEAGVTVFRRGGHEQRVGLAVTNLTNALYSEFANASFFRPEPGRGAAVHWSMTF